MTGSAGRSGSPSGPSVPPWRDPLTARLTAARSRHFLGPGSVAAQVEHSLAFALLVPDPPANAVDLGSGAGVPGLVLACFWPASHWLLVESNLKRADFLRGSVAALGLAERVEVTSERAEVTGREAAHRAAADLVVARGFGPPPVTAECAAPLLHPPKSILVVAEPPGGRPERWPSTALAELGLVRAGGVTDPVAMQRLRQETDCPDRFPRRVGIPAKRPLW